MALTQVDLMARELRAIAKAWRVLAEGWNEKAMDDPNLRGWVGGLTSAAKSVENLLEDYEEAVVSS